MVVYEDTYKNLTVRMNANVNDLYVRGHLNANIEQISPHVEGDFFSEPIAPDDTVYKLHISTDNQNMTEPYFVEITKNNGSGEEVIIQQSSTKPFSTTMISHYLGSYSYTFTNDVNCVLLFFHDVVSDLKCLKMTKPQDTNRQLSEDKTLISSIFSMHI